ncbi:heavy metal-associated isoprenylated plant protein 47-like isoform X1 [Pyrus x bretschneideri]|uniref:heavy metal-associated isoprenylated plant protein 47-like isoform X1 n=1 Tax=Pyrus x bretschneideri TaxID=225117 RepID=UPI00202FA90F|nr:heavy metal-associated isoprenylated plant protein 47-like isoform X1 [Pyrus x bretschneideri]
MVDIHNLITTCLFGWLHDLLQQSITIEAQFRCEKCRSKAMEIAVTEDGVISMAFKGANRDQMVITGDGVDAARLAKSLRKKLGYADLLSVEEITEMKPQKKSAPE